MFYRIGLVAMSASLLLVPTVGEAAPVLTSIAPKYTTTDSPSNHVVSSGGFFDGVGDFIVNNTNRCSSGLLADGLHVLTAAHCVTDNSGNDNFVSGNISFFGDSGTYTVGVDEVFVHTGWTGALGNGNDIAVVRLNSVVNSEITRYDIYRDPDEVGQIGDKVGVGRSGTGATGDTIASGTKRTVQNRYDIAGLPIAALGNISSNVLLYDFDNGVSDNDALGRLAPFLPPNPFLIDPIGVGINEGMSAPGDSGGPTFLSNMIAGVTSFGLTYSISNQPPVDINSSGSPDSSFGELAGDTRVSSYASFIDGFISPVPAPFGLLLLTTGLIGLAGLRRRLA